MSKTGRYAVDQAHRQFGEPLSKPALFTYKCVDCGMKNTTTEPPEDSVLNCSLCGFSTVQTCQGVAAK